MNFIFFTPTEQGLVWAPQLLNSEQEWEPWPNQSSDTTPSLITWQRLTYTTSKLQGLLGYSKAFHGGQKGKGNYVMKLLMGKTLMIGTSGKKKKKKQKVRGISPSSLSRTQNTTIEIKLIWSSQIFFTAQREHTSETEWGKMQNHFIITVLNINWGFTLSIDFYVFRASIFFYQICTAPNENCSYMQRRWPFPWGSQNWGIMCFYSQTWQVYFPVRTHQRMNSMISIQRFTKQGTSAGVSQTLLDTIKALSQ